MTFKNIFSKNTSLMGGFFVAFYIMASALSNVFVNHSTQHLDPLVSLFYTSIFTVIFFSVFNFRKLQTNISLIKANIHSIIWLNFLNAIIWLVIFYSLKYLSPYLFSCLFLGSIPIIIFITTRIFNQSFTIKALPMFLGLAALFLVMIWLAIQESNSKNFADIVNYGVIVFVIGGGVGALIMKTSKRLAEKKLAASLVVSLRFYGLLLFSLLTVYFQEIPLNLSQEMIVQLVSLAFVSMVLPLFLLQKSLEYLNTLHVSIMITTIPVLTYFIQLLTGHFRFSIAKLLLISIFSLLLVGLTYLKKIQE